MQWTVFKICILLPLRLWYQQKISLEQQYKFTWQQPIARSLQLIGRLNAIALYSSSNDPVHPQRLGLLYSNRWIHAFAAYLVPVWLTKCRQYNIFFILNSTLICLGGNTTLNETNIHCITAIYTHLWWLVWLRGKCACPVAQGPPTKWRATATHDLYHSVESKHDWQLQHHDHTPFLGCTAMFRVGKLVSPPSSTSDEWKWNSATQWSECKWVILCDAVHNLQTSYTMFTYLTAYLMYCITCTHARTAQIQKEGHYSRAACEIHVLGSVVVVGDVLLPLGVLEHLRPKQVDETVWFAAGGDQQRASSMLQNENSQQLWCATTFLTWKDS